MTTKYNLEDNLELLNDLMASFVEPFVDALKTAETVESEGDFKANIREAIDYLDGVKEELQKFLKDQTDD